MELLSTPGAPMAAARWSVFSLAAFQILSRLRHAGVAPRTVIDVGANVGQFAVAARHLLPDAAVYSVEPDPRTAARLRRNLGPDSAANVIVSAIGDREGPIDLQVNRDSQVSSVLPLGGDRQRFFPSSTVVERLEVPMTTLDALFLPRALPAPILLKIDVQGYEDRVIAGATALLPSVRWVLMEVSFARLYDGERSFGTLLDLMAARGFRFVRPVNIHQSATTREIIEMDALFEQAEPRDGRRADDAG